MTTVNTDALGLIVLAFLALKPICDMAEWAYHRHQDRKLYRHDN